MKLYEIPEGSIINAETSNSEGLLGTQIKFLHIDGMYSLCTVVEKENETCHLGSSQELELNEDGTYSLK